MSLKKDKEKVLNETIEDSRLEEFFSLVPPANTEVDYHILERAYRGLQAPDFSRFVELFVDKGFNINSQGPQGTLLQVASTHANSSEYVTTLRDAGATG